MDDDPALRNSIAWLLNSVHIPTEQFGSVGAFLSAVGDERAGCVVADIRLPDASGIELLERVAARERPAPVILITGHADVRLAVRAMRAGAFDFLEKPVRDDALLDRVQQAIRWDAANRARWAAGAAARALLARLSDREREIFELLVRGLANKQIAKQLQVSVKTVEAHRSRLYEKLERQHLGDLIVLATSAGLDCSSSPAE